MYRILRAFLLAGVPTLQQLQGRAKEMKRARTAAVQLDQLIDLKNLALTYFDVLHTSVKRDPTKFSNSRNAGPHSTFSRDRAAFRCVSPIEGERPGP
jgi:hypothetical protein